MLLPALVLRLVSPQGSTRVAVMVPLTWAMTLLSSNGSAGLAAEMTAVIFPL